MMGPNNQLLQAPEMQEDDEDDSNGSNGPSPTQQDPSELQLQLKKQECCDQFTASFKVGDLYETPKALMAAIVDGAKQLQFSVRRDGYSYVCSRAKKNNGKKQDENESKARNFRSFKTDCPFKISFNYADRKMKHELTTEDLPFTRDCQTRIRVTPLRVCATRGNVRQISLP